eukprot:3519746-Rhodomonas_salina.1
MKHLSCTRAYTSLAHARTVGDGAVVAIEVGPSRARALAPLAGRSVVPASTLEVREPRADRYLGQYWHVRLVLARTLWVSTSRYALGQYRVQGSH